MPKKEITAKYPHFLSFLVGFAFSIISGRMGEIFDSELTIPLLNFVLIAVLIVLLRKFGENIREGLTIAASLLLGVVAGIFIY